MASQRPRSRNYRSLSAASNFRIGLNKCALRRPASAKDLFESNNHRRNEEAWKQEELEANVNFLKKREWQTKFFNSLAQPQHYQQDWKFKEEKEKLLKERRSKLRCLFTEDRLQYEKERENLSQNQKDVSENKFFPEVEILKNRLQELKIRNKEEYDKMAKKLSFEVWRKNNSELQQAESDRLNKFVREAWVDQKQWKEEEREQHIKEKKKAEEEAQERIRQEEIEERKREEEKHKKLLDWKHQLDDQNNLLKIKEEEEIKLKVQEKELEKKNTELDEIILMRQKIIDARKRKDLELFWAKQYQLKLKKKAADIQWELLQDQQILQDLISKAEYDSKEKENEKIEEAKWMTHVLEEQKKLEEQREKEYDLLFSEEAMKAWHKREADWQRERIARDNLMQEVMHGLKQQIEQKMNSTKENISQTNSSREHLQMSIENMQSKLDYELQSAKTKEIYQSNQNFKSPVSESRSARVEQLFQDQSILERKQEIARLEQEMKKLWEGSYVPPRYGRKKVTW